MLDSVEYVQNFDVSVKGFLTNRDALLNQINNVFTVSRYTFPFRREFELDIEKYLFRPFSIITGNIIQIEIENALKRYFPKITIVNMTTNLNDSSRKYEITIDLDHPLFDGTETINLNYSSNV